MIGLRRRRLVRALGARDEHLRWEAAKALTEVKDPRVVRRVERVLERGGADEARAAAAYVLGFSGELDVAPSLARRLGDGGESVAVRAHAAEALGHLLQFETVLADVRTAILAALRDPEPEVRFWSAFAAGVLDLQESRPQLERLASSDQALVEGWWTISAEAKWALRCLDGEEDPPLPSRNGAS